MHFFVCFVVLLLSAICNGQSLINAEKSPLCKVRNTYIKVEGECDSYIECRDYLSTEMLCPDGLHFNPNAQWPEYACGYPQDVPCVGRGITRKYNNNNHIQIIINQNIRNFENSFTFSHLFLLTEPANPTADCAHQYGYFPSPVADPNDCGHYRICNAGRAIEMHCPTGLAFNPVTAQCDWPELVPTCDVETFVGYQCPPAAIDRNGNPVVTNHKYEGDCSAFYSCINGHARILSCDTGLAFNPVTSRCEDADRVQCEAKSIAKYY
ncbi:protein obstructor-E-like [Nymphalis io]|uniref:protein obstructor-E-like n=1 Tax=Inachis io TaxID=171585 RepID=UPI0021685E44|nr:protein obstructor-E-like [Nymphalis io]XP_050352194.1 protein obstructor-E-like [Nymphalis io]